MFDFSLLLTLLPLFLIAMYFLSGINIVMEQSRRPLYRFGRYVRTLNPGFSWTEPFSTRAPLDDIYVNEVVRTLDLEDSTSLQTRDNVPITFVTVMTSLIDPESVQKFVLAVQDGDEAVERRALTAVSEVVSMRTLDELLHHREDICAEIAKKLSSRVAEWGVVIRAVELRDVRITDPSIQEAIALKARAAKEAEAEIVRAEAQIKIAQELSQAAEKLTCDGWRLKNLEVLLEMTRSAENNTVVIPSDAVNLLSSLTAVAKS